MNVDEYLYHNKKNFISLQNVKLLMCIFFLGNHIFYDGQQLTGSVCLHKPYVSLVALLIDCQQHLSVSKNYNVHNFIRKFITSNY